MKLRETTRCLNCEGVAEHVARQGVEIADLKAQLAAALDRIDKLQQENARLRNDNEQLNQQVAAARKALAAKPAAAGANASGQPSPAARSKADRFSSSCSNRSNLIFAVFPRLRSCRQAPDGFSSLSRLRLSP